jgi:hypothetical protein
MLLEEAMLGSTCYPYAAGCHDRGQAVRTAPAVWFDDAGYHSLASIAIGNLKWDSNAPQFKADW